MSLLVVGLSHLDPVNDPSREILAPKRRLIGIPHIFCQFERAIIGVGRGVQRKCQQANQHPFVSLRRMPRDSEAVVGIDVTVEVGELKGGFVDGRFDGHGR